MVAATVTCRLTGIACGLVPLAVAALAWVDRDSQQPVTPQPAIPKETANPLYEYVGSKRCRMCHSQWHKSWQQSAKGDSFESLRPGVHKEYKVKVGLEPGKDYTTETTCLTCHTVGFGQPGGYEVPSPNDKKAARFAATREGVGCEACHGPGGGFTQVMRDIYLKERPYQQQEVRRAGLRNIEPQLCLDCHDAKAPCIADDSPPLKVDDESLRSGHGFHEHFPLKYRKR